MLLLGLLYDLPSPADRLTVLREASRVVRPGGVVYGAAMSRWAARLDGMISERMDERGPQMLDLMPRLRNRRRPITCQRWLHGLRARPQATRRGAGRRRAGGHRSGECRGRRVPHPRPHRAGGRRPSTRSDPGRPGGSRHTNRGPRPSAPVQGPPHDRREVLHVGRAQHREVVTEHGVVFQVR